MLAINYIVTSLHESILEQVLEQMNEQNRNIYINPFTVAHIFHKHSTKRNDIRNLLVKNAVYIVSILNSEDSKNINESIYHLNRKIRANNDSSEFNINSKSQLCRSTVMNEMYEDEKKEYEDQNSHLPSLVQDFQSRNAMLVNPITTQNESLKIETFTNKDKYDEMNHMLNDGTFVNESKYHEIKIEKYFSRTKQNVSNSSSYSIKTFENIDWYEILVSLCEFDDHEIFEILYHDFINENGNLSEKEIAFSSEIYKIL